MRERSRKKLFSLGFSCTHPFLKNGELGDPLIDILCWEDVKIETKHVTFHSML